MNLEEAKGLRAMHNAIVHPRQKTALEVVDWLIAEVERLTAENDELFGEVEHFKRLAQTGDCCKAPDYCGGECTCEICDPQGNIEYWKAYAGEAEKDNEKLTADLEELSGETERLKERVNELDGIAYTNGELYNKEYLKREEAEARLAGVEAALELYADKTRWSRAWGDDEALLYNIRENGGDGWSIAQEALMKC